jgi:uncharacterized delta-60 repeat protein
MAGISVTLGNPGTLDTSFGGDGKVTAAVGTGRSLAFQVLVQPDGKIVAAGEAINGTYDDFALVRFTASGSLDAGFGSGGKVITAIGVGDDTPSGLLMQPDGKIVLSGSTFPGDLFATDGDAAVVRYTANGSLDASFSGDGKVVTSIGGDDRLTLGSAVLPGGKLLFVGLAGLSATNTEIALVRYTAAGALDTSFGGDGTVITSLGNGEDAALALAVQPDGKILVAGGFDNGTNSDALLMRFNADGSLDTGFGASGKVVNALGTGIDVITSIALQPDGKIVAIGTSEVAADDGDIFVMRFLADGSLDTSFGTGGKVMTKLSAGDELAFKVLVQPDGGIVAVAATIDEANNDFIALCYTPSGAPDTRFGGDGKVNIDFAGGTDAAAALALQDDGRLVIAGGAWTGSQSDIGVARVFGTTNSVKGSAGADTLTGAAGADTFKGLAGADIIKGGAGNDALVGGASNDKLTGGLGADKFVFDAPLASNRDSVLDFKPGQHDKIVLDNDVFAKLGAAGALKAGWFSADGAAHDANDYILYKASTGALYYDADGNGAGAAVQFATMGTTVHPTLHNTDFQIVD